MTIVEQLCVKRSYFSLKWHCSMIDEASKLAASTDKVSRIFSTYILLRISSLSSSNTSTSNILPSSDLFNNQIGALGAQHLADALRNNTVTLFLSSSLSYPHLHFFTQTLTTLNLYNNQIGDKLSDRIKELIKRNEQRAKTWESERKRWPIGNKMKLMNMCDWIFVFLRKIIKLVYVAYDYSDDNEMIVVWWFRKIARSLIIDESSWEIVLSSGVVSMQSIGSKWQNSAFDCSRVCS